MSLLTEAIVNFLPLIETSKAIINVFLLDAELISIYYAPCGIRRKMTWLAVRVRHNKWMHIRNLTPNTVLRTM